MRVPTLRVAVISSSVALGCSNASVSGGDASGSGSSEAASASESAQTSSDDGSESEGSGEASETGEDSCLGAPGPWDAGFELPPEPDIGGDAEAGRWTLLHGDYVSCGIPYDLFMLGKGLLGTYADGAALPWREGKSADLPYNWNLVVSEGGTELATMNCLTCHAGELNGEFIIGLGRHDADFTQDLGSLLAALPQLPGLTDAVAELNKFRARYEALGPYIQTYTIGSNPADDVAVILAAHRNPFTLEWSDEQLIPINPPLVPLDTPPWWRVGKKAGHFYNGMSRGDHRGTMMYASSLCIDDAAQAAEIFADFDDIYAYLASLEPPPWPWEVDAQLAAEGEALFECDCAGCHGTYDEDPELESFPNLLIPAEVVGTDPMLAQIAEGPVSALVEWFNSSWYGTVTQLEATEPFVGYTAPPLDGIWATAPFLHNGSVPTLELVLNSSARPDYWQRVDYDSSNYDQDALGWPWIGLSSGQEGVPAAQAKRIYDSDIPGHQNGGHTFGDHLSSSERAALLEYLKTL